MILQDIISEIDRYKEKLDSFGALDEQTKKRLWEKIRLDWNYHSNSMEGNALSYGETKSLLLYGLTTKGKNLRDFLDMKGHDKALNYLLDIVDKKQLITESVVKKLHQMIIPDPFDEEMEVNPGVYKTEPNEVILNPEFTHSIGEKVEFLEPEKVAEELNKLITKTNNLLNPPKRQKEKYTLHPLLIAAAFHLEFELIHPFNDGNGRLGRILMNLILMQCGYPPVLIKLEERDEYLNTLNKARNEGVEIFAEFLGKCLIRSLKLYMDAAEGKPIEEKGDFDKRIEQLKARLADNSEGKLRQTDQETLNTIIGVVVPLFNKLVSAINKISEFFVERRIIVYIHRLDEMPIDVEVVISDDNKLIAVDFLSVDKFSIPLDKDKSNIFRKLGGETGTDLANIFSQNAIEHSVIVGLNKVSLIAVFSKFVKSDLTKLSIRSEVDCSFAPERYTFSVNNEHTSDYKYGEKVTAEEMEGIVNSFRMSLLNKIEEYVKSNQKKISN